MNNLSKDDQKEKARLSEELAKRRLALDEAVAAFNEAKDKAFEVVQSALDEFNAAATDADGWRADIHSQLEDYFGDKSEGWQSGERGEAYSAWMNAFEDELEPLDIEPPADIEVPDLDDYADRIEGYPDDPDSV